MEWNHVGKMFEESFKTLGVSDNDVIRIGDELFNDESATSEQFDDICKKLVHLSSKHPEAVGQFLLAFLRCIYMSEEERSKTIAEYHQMKTESEN